MQAHSKRASFLAARMEKEGIPVIYPGLESHPQRKLLQSMMNPAYGYGGMLTVDLGTTERASELAGKLQQEKFGLYAVSLGFSRTLMSCPARSTSSEIPEDEQKLMKLSPGLIRFSIGYTGDAETMWDRFIRCYRAISR
jgi:methionine-gamma-lyase